MGEGRGRRASHGSIAGTWTAILAFEVTDDGKGFSPAETGHGTGLQGMADRLAALGGELEVTSVPGRASTVAGRLPKSAS